MIRRPPRSTLSLHDALPILRWKAVRGTVSGHESDPASPDGGDGDGPARGTQGRFHRSEEHTSELQSHSDLVCRLLLEKKKKTITQTHRNAIMNSTNSIRSVA